MTQQQTIDEQVLGDLVDRAVGDFGATLGAALVVIGDRLGLYRGLVDLGPTDAATLAAHTGTVERNVREWLSAQAAAGYVTYDGADDRGVDQWSLSAEQREAFTVETSPAFVVGGFEVVLAAAKSESAIAEAFRHGRGFGWHQHDAGLFRGTERFFRPGYAAALVGEWLPALTGTVEALTSGATVADVGCGHGASTILMAEAFPGSTFHGYDYHPGSIEQAEAAARDSGISDRATFGVAGADGYPGSSYDLVCFFDCLHDMGDPVGALRHARSTLSPEGVVMLVEPMAGDSVAENLNPIGRVFYGASTLVCTPHSQSQPVSRALGAQAGTRRLTEVALEAGFTRVRVAAETPFNLILELAG
jgi:2-polyprenyl-3-methyl-5-hydroxy-6-metoxy-1,4-benzoquinol methylase